MHAFGYVHVFKLCNIQCCLANDSYIVIPSWLLVSLQSSLSNLLLNVIIASSINDLQSSIAILNQLPGQLVFTQIKTTGYS